MEGPDVTNLRFGAPNVPLVRQAPLRFAVGHPAGISSNSWKVWTSRRGDVYLACRDNYRETKVSLHASGRWRMGLTRDAVTSAPGLIEEGQDRAWSVWDEPPAEIPGAVRAFEVFFLPEELALSPPHRTAWPDNIIFVGEAPLGAANVATLWVTDGLPTLAVESGPTITLAALPLDDRRFVQVTLHVERFQGEARDDVLRAIEVGRQDAEAAGIEVPEGGRFLFFGARPTGPRYLIEANFHRSDP